MRVPVRQTQRATPWLAITGYAGLGLAALVLGALTFFFLAQPVDLIRDRIVAELKASTGGDVVAGAASLSLLPRPMVSVSGVSLTSPAVAIDRLDAELALLSLLGGEMRITRLVLTRPTFTTGVAGAALPGSGREPAPAAGRRQAPVPEKRRPLALDALAVRVIDGRVRLASGGREISAVDCELALGRGGGPLRATGSLATAGERLAFDSSLSGLPGLQADRTSQLTLHLTGQAVEASFAGELAPEDATPLAGRLEAEGSVRALAALLGAASDEVPDPVPFRLSAKLSLAEGRLALTALDGALGTAALGGEVTVEARGQRPHVSGTLRLTELDLGRLLLRPAAARQGAADPAPAPAGGGAGEAVQPPQARRSEGDWSDDRIDLSPLGLADADLKLSVARIIYKEFTTGAGDVTFALQNRLAKLTIGDVPLYGGRGQGVVTLDGSNRTPAIGANLALEGVSALPLLKDALGFGWLEGRGSIALALAGQGASERQVVSSLNGRLAVKMSNGAIRGADVAKILSAIEQVRLEGLGAADKTQFNEFSATFLIANGVAQNQDLRLTGPRVAVSGSGSVALAGRSIDYSARTRLIGGAPSPGAVISIGNLEIPLRIEGPWSKPNVSIVGQEGLAATVKQIGKNLNSQEVQDAIKGLLGGDDRVKPGDLIDKLFKKQQ
jgi:AsmA protein